MLRMDGWKFESTVLVENGSTHERLNEYVEVLLTVPEEQVSDPQREVRVIYKKGWNDWDRIVPCQVGRFTKKDGFASFKVAFLADIPSSAVSRYGILYGNPEAPMPSEKCALIAKEAGNCYNIDNQAYVISIDKKSGQIGKIIYKYFRTGFLMPVELSSSALLQPGVSVAFPASKKDASGVEWVTSSSCREVKIETESGGVAFRHKSTRKIIHSSIKKGIDIVTETIFPANNPFFHVRENVYFNDDTPVFGLRLGGHRFLNNTYSHFSFRPVTRGMKKSEIEEIGHVLIDPDYTKNIPCGSVLSGFMPLLMPWTALMNIHRGKCYAQTRYLLDWHCANKYGHEIPFYRPATYLFRENDFYETAIMPVYTKNCSNPDNTTVIPAGTEFCYDLAVSFSPFEEVVWGKKADLIGRIMNSPLKVEVYPRLTTKDEGWSDHPVSTLSGKRMCDYQTSGVR